MRRALSLGALALAACSRQGSLSLVVVDVSAERTLAGPVTVELRAGPVMHSFTVATGLSSTPVSRGLYLGEEVRGAQSVSGRAESGGCTYQDSTQVAITAAGQVAPAALVLRAAPGCAAPGDAAGPPIADAAAASSPDAAADSPAAPPPAAPPPDTAPPPDMVPVVAPAPPPSLAACKDFRQDLTPPGCDVASPVDQAGVQALAFSPDGKLLATATQLRAVGSWTVLQSDLRQTGAEMGGNPMHAIGYSPDGTLLAAAGAEGDLKVWRVGSDWVRVLTIAGMDPKRDHRWLAFAADNDRILTASPLATSVQIWSVARQGLAAEIAVGPIAAVATNQPPPSNGPWWVAVATTGNSVAFYNLDAPSPTPSAPVGVNGVVRRVALSPDGHTLAISSDVGLFLWDVTDKTRPIPLSPALQSRTLPNDHQDLAFAPSGRYLLASIPSVQSVALYNVDTRRELATFTMRGAVLSLAWSPDGRAIALGRACGVVNHCRD